MAARAVSDPSLGEAGGIFAGCLALLAAIGKAVQWLLAWGERRAERTAASRETKLAVWHAELADRERKLDGQEDGYRARIERQIAAMGERVDRREVENRALRLAFELVAGALRERDPHNAALKRAEALLHAAFPIDPIVPITMAEQLGRIDVAGKK